MVACVSLQIPLRYSYPPIIVLSTTTTHDYGQLLSPFKDTLCNHFSAPNPTQHEARML